MSKKHMKINKGIKLTPQVTVPADPENGDAVYDDTLKKFRGYQDGSWGDIIVNNSSVEVNHISNSGIENDALNYNIYDDSAAIPVDGTGGSPTAITIARTTTPSEILRGIGSLKISKSAVDGQGEGVSIDVTVDRQDDVSHNAELEITFSKESTVNYNTGDLKVFIYDVTNAAIIEVSNFEDGDIVGNNGIFRATFPTTNSLEYRLILHTTSTNALAWDMTIDDVRIGPALAVPGFFATAMVDTGPMIVDGVSATPTKGTTTIDTVTKAREGQFGFFKYEYSCSTAGPVVAAGDYLFSLPDGLEFDLNFVTLNTSALAQARLSPGSIAGEFQCVLGNVANILAGRAIAYSATQFRIIGLANGASLGTVGSISGFDFDHASLLSFAGWIKAPIKGWDVGATVSPNDVELVKFSAIKNGGAVTTLVEFPNWTTVEIDSHDAFNATTGVFTVPRDGDYLFAAQYQQTVANTSTGIVLVNGARYKDGDDVTSNASKGISCMLPGLVKGDTVGLSVAANATLVATAYSNHMSITEIPNFKVFSVLAQKHVATITDEKASGTDGGIFTAGSYQTRILNTLNDTGIGVTLAANQFTLPAGKYYIEATAPAVSAGSSVVIRHKAKLRNITDSTDELIGQSSVAQAPAASAVIIEGVSSVKGIVTIASAKTFELQHRAQVTAATNGFGLASSFGDDEVYTIIKIEKLG